MKVKTALLFGLSFLFFTTIAILIGKSPPRHPNVGLSVAFGAVFDVILIYFYIRYGGLKFEFCEKYNYTLENETTTTEDGYILTMHRITCSRYKKSCPNKKSVVLLMHGITGSSFEYLFQGVGKSLAFQLADKGYDVWLGNQRGNYYSRQHVMLEADYDPSFWDFSFHEIGFYDLPAMIDHITKRTNATKISYVGLSQACPSYLIMTSLKPEYNNKIQVANFMAPAISLYNSRNYLFRFWQYTNFIAEPLSNFFEIYEVFNRDHIVSQMLAYVCVGPHKIANWLCTELIGKLLSGMTGDEIDYDIFPYWFSNYPSGASTKQLLHFLQGKISGNFSQYDYYERNEIIYNSLSPPQYNVSKSTAPVAVFFSRGDDFINVETLYKELKKIPNVILKYKVQNDNFNHADFILSKNINTLLYDKIIEVLEKYNKNK